MTNGSISGRVSLRTTVNKDISSSYCSTHYPLLRKWFYFLSACYSLKWFLNWNMTKLSQQHIHITYSDKGIVSHWYCTQVSFRSTSLVLFSPQSLKFLKSKSYVMSHSIIFNKWWHFENNFFAYLKHLQPNFFD